MPLGDGVSTEIPGSVDEALFPMEIDIVRALYDVALEGYAPDAGEEWNGGGHWTYAAKQVLWKLGGESGYLVYPYHDDNKGSFHGEWLFDFTWVDAQPLGAPNEYDWRHTRGLALACECEWKATETAILEDFYKLTFALAELRLFVYTHKPIRVDGKSTTAADLCKRACTLSRGFPYLLIGLPERADGGFRLDAWTA